MAGLLLSVTEVRIPRTPLGKQEEVKMDQLGKVVAVSNFRAGNLLLFRSGNRGNFVPVTIFPASRASTGLL